MQTPRLRRLVPWGCALALGLSSALVSAQDGGGAGTSPGTAGPPVTNPRTNDNATPANPTPARPRTTSDVLPGVPSSASDPAPPGTRAVRVDRPSTTETGPGGAAPAPATAARRANAQILTAEGVVTRIDRAGSQLNGELQRFAFDPSQDWFSYANRGATGVQEKDEDRPKGSAEIKAANEKQHEDAPDKPKVMEMAITKRTYVYTYARSADGTDQYGMTTSSSPETSSSFSGLTNRTRTTPDAPGPQVTNFTNLKEGSFVAVRYRKVGDLNEVLNLTLIEMPLNPAGTTAPAASRGTPPARGTAPAGTTAPARVPSVPLTPVGASLPGN